MVNRLVNWLIVWKGINTPSSQTWMDTQNTIKTTAPTIFYRRIRWNSALNRICISALCARRNFIGVYQPRGFQILSLLILYSQVQLALINRFQFRKLQWRWTALWRALHLFANKLINKRFSRCLQLDLHAYMNILICECRMPLFVYIF